MMLGWLLLVLQWLGIWATLVSVKMGRDRTGLSGLLYDMPLFSRRMAAIDALYDVSLSRHFIRRFFLLSPEPLYQTYYAIVTYEIARENLRLDFLRRLWIDLRAEQLLGR